MGYSSRSDRAKYYIQTTGGNALYEGNDEVTVQIAPESFLKKRIRDINSGEMVLFDVQSVRTTLEDVEPHLRKSPLYDRAQQFVFKETPEGDKIPAFRDALLRSLAEKGQIGKEDLEAKINGRDNYSFSGKEYEDGARFLVEAMLNSRAPERDIAYIPQAEAVEDWLRGKTLAPQDHRVFKLLMNELGGEFAQFISEHDDPKGFYRNYRIYVVMRQVIMKTLNSWRGISIGEEKEEVEKQKRIDIGKEIDLIRSHFLKDITPELKAVMVTDVRPISKQTAYDIQRQDRLLGDGILRGKIPEIKNNIISYNQTLEDGEILVHYLSSAVSNLPLLDVFLQGTTASLKWQIAKDAIFPVLRKFKEPFDPFLLAAEEERNERWGKLGREHKGNLQIEQMQEVLEGSRGLVETILNGVGDRCYDFERGTLTRLIESLFRVRRAVPENIWKYQVHCVDKSKPSPMTKEEIKQQYNVRLNREGVHLDGGVFYTNLLDSVLSLPEEERTMGINSLLKRRDLSVNSTLTQLVVQTINNLKDKGLHSYANGLFYRTRDYTHGVLVRHGLEQILPLREPDFLIESLGISFPKPPKR